MLSKVLSYGLNGIEGYMVTTELDISIGLPGFEIVGLGDTAIKESKERVKSAIRNSGFHFPINKITVNLAPADKKKEGPIFDLSIAMGILTATGQLENEKIKDFWEDLFGLFWNIYSFSYRTLCILLYYS